MGRILSGSTISVVLLSSVLLFGCTTGNNVKPEGIGNPTKPDAGASEQFVCNPPKFMTFRILGQDALFRVGWTGVAHNISFSSDAVFSVEVTDCTDECFCNFRGPVDLDTVGGGYGVNHRRCVSDTSKTCVSDDDCGEDVSCEYFMGTSVGLVTTGVDACAMIHFQERQGKDEDGNDVTLPALEGTVDVQTGNYSFDSYNVAIVQGLSCGSCAGDPDLFDGNEDGTCQYSDANNPSNGIACDGHAIYTGGRIASYDCPFTRVGDLSLELQLGPLQTGSRQLKIQEGSPPCAEGEGLCFCGWCEGTTDICTNDRECVGKCVAADRTQPSSCPGGCFEVDATRGSGYCGNFSACFVGSGQIGEAVAAIGKPDAFKNGRAQPRFASIGCFPGDSTNVSHIVMGFPGLGAFETDMEVIATY